MKLRKAEAFGVFDNHYRRIRNVDSDLDHRRRNKKVDISLREGTHYLVLFLRLHFSVKQAESVILKLVFRKGLEIFLGRNKASFVLSLFDQGTDDIALMTRFNMLLYIVIDPFVVGGADTVGIDRLTALRIFVDDRNVKVSVQYEGKGAGYRRSRHNENVWRFSLRGKDRPLLNAEAVLLVGYNKSEIFKINVIRKQSVGTYNKVDLADLEPFFKLVLLFLTETSRKQGDPYIGSFEEFREDLKMLLG